MDITLNDDDVRTLRGFLYDNQPQLEREGARTDSKEVRHLNEARHG